MPAGESIHLSGLIVLYWDHILTFRTLAFSGLVPFTYQPTLVTADELKYFWKRPLSKGSYLFFVNRYLNFFANTVIFHYIFLQGQSKSSFSSLTAVLRCDILANYHQFLLVASQIVVGLIMATRVYALWNRDRKILWTIVLVALGCVGVAAWSVASVSGHHQRSTCPPPNLTQATAFKHSIAWTGMLVFDMTIFVLTVVKSYRGMYINGQRVPVPLLELLLRDELNSIMTIANIANVGSFYFKDPHMRGSFGTPASAIAISLASRLNINLRADMQRLMNPDTNLTIPRTALRFESDPSSSEGTDSTALHEIRSKPERSGADGTTSHDNNDIREVDI
ncbi:hypothetical protein DL96DRAFT_1608618 [Flagelloscypha sp. PMI_526]|nr:hypothetical protein DL96DRAFT_1608618 [Flagelloscypha sp. PMI_526]